MTLPKQIVDAHHHLWDLSHCQYPWLMERGVRRFFGDPTPIQKDYLVQDYRSDHGDVAVIKSVHIQVGAAAEHSVRETLWAQSLADDVSFPHAIVGYCDLTSADFEMQLDAHQEAVNFRGVRQIVGRSAEEDARTGTQSLLGSQAFIKGLNGLAARGISFDLQLTPPMMLEAAHVFYAIPKLPVALCHAGSLSGFSSAAISDWEDGLRSLARHENMLCKLSGFAMFDPDWTAASIRSQVLRAIDIFGPDRIAFGSNFPVEKLYSSFSEIFEAYDAITCGFTDDERDAMFHGNASRFYQI